LYLVKGLKTDSLQKNLDFNLVFFPERKSYQGR
jgi:hypothetical protein